MSDQTRVTIPVTVEVRTGMPEVGEGVVRGLREDLFELVDGLGIPGRPRVRVVDGTAARIVRFRVFGRVRPYSRRLMLRAWRAVAPPELQNLPRRQPPGGERGFPDAWMSAVPDHDPRLMIRLVRRLGLEAIKTNPGCLMGPDVAAAYAPTLGAPAEMLAEALARILDMGLSLRDRGRVMETLATAHLLGVTLDDAVDAVFDGMRRDEIAISVPPDVTLQDQLRQQFPILQETLLAEFGITNHLELVTERVAGEAEMGIRINHQMSVVPVLRPDEILLDETPARLEQRGLQGRAFPNPATREDCTAVASALMPEVDRLGISYWTPAGFLALVVYAEVRRLVHRVISAEEVQRRLAQLEETAPVLVSAVLSRFTAWDIARAMRGLAAEGIAPRDLELILHLMVLLDTLAVEEDGLSFFDDRPPIGERGEEAAPETILRWVRLAMRRQVTEQCTQGRDFVVALRVPEDIEDRLSNAGEADLTEADVDRAQDSLWDALALLPPSGDVNPVVLTSARARVGVRAIVRDEFPGMYVVAEDELLPEVRICTVSDREGLVTAQIAITADRVRRFLERLQAGMLRAIGDGVFDVVVDGTPVRVSVIGEDGRTIVEVATGVGRSVPVTEGLFRWLAEHGQDSRFGHLGCTVEDDFATVHCRYTLLGDFLDYEELRLAVQAVAAAGAAARAVIQTRFGGETGPV